MEPAAHGRDDQLKREHPRSLLWDTTPITSRHSPGRRDSAVSPRRSAGDRQAAARPVV